MENKYVSIINYNYTGSKTHPKMPLENRVAIFAPFAALEGYSDDIQEENRLTTQKQELTTETLIKLNNTIQKLLTKQNQKPLIEITYFEKDNKKSGGSYKKIEDNLHQIDEVNMLIILKNKQKIKIENIIYIKEIGE